MRSGGGVLNILETDGLVHIYSGTGTSAIDGIDITIEKGVKTVLLGANGAGKSTLFYHMNGVMRPTSGTVSAFGEPIRYRRKPLSELRSRIAIVLQNPDDQIFGQTVESDVAYGPANLRMSEDEIARRVDEALFLTGLEDLRERNTMQLSYGQRKRLALAGALAMKPEILIMDEPTAGLDPQMASELMELSEQLHDSGTTVVMSTHDVDLAYAWADRLHVLRNGRLVFSGDSEDFFADDELVYLSGLTCPLIFSMNRSLSLIGRIEERPCPHTETQMVCKTTDVKNGRMTVLPAGADFSPSAAEKAAGQLVSPCIGIYGAMSRRAVLTDGMDVDFPFNGLESCIGECLAGRDALLICDRGSVSRVKRTLEELERFGGRIRASVMDRP